MDTNLPITNTNVYQQMAFKIIQFQEKIVGVLAWNLAGKVHGLVITKNQNPELAITGEPKTVINDLVAKYVFLWGRLGKLECQEATMELTGTMNSTDIPESLQKEY